MKRVLVTGASGFVGTHLIEHIRHATDWEVFGTSYGPGSDLHSWLDDEHILELNLMDRSATIEVIRSLQTTYVVHLAALSSPKQSFTDEGFALVHNQQIQLNVLDAVRADGHMPEKILVIGSAEEYGLVVKDDNPIHEETPLRPTSPYAVSKIAQDYLGLQYFLTYQLPIVRLRPFNHTGERRPPHFVLPAFAEQVARIEAGLQPPELLVGNLEAVRDFCDVKDVVRAYTICLEKAEAGEVYNIGSGQGVQIGELLDMVLEQAKVDIRVVSDPSRMKPADVPTLVADTRKIRDLTGWKPEIPLKETVKRVLDYWRAQQSIN